MTRLNVSILAGILCVGLFGASTALAGGVGSPDLPGGYFEPTGSFFLRNSLDTGPVDTTSFILPNSGWLPVAGDWDGDGTDGLGIFSTVSGTWYLVDDVADSPSAPLPADYTAFITTDGTGWIPIAGNWDGVGGDGIGIFNVSTGAMFLVDDATQGASAASAADYTVFMVTDGTDWLPVVGDWDGDGQDGVGIYNKTTGTFFLVDDVTVGGPLPADYSAFMSPLGSQFLPVAGSWDGMVGDGIGIWQISSGAFFLAYDPTQGATAATAADLSFFIEGGSGPIGGSTDWAPVTGDWDGLGGAN